MKVLFIESSADGLLDLAIRAKAAGHAVSYYLKDYDQYKTPVGKGLVDRVPAWEPHIRKADLVLLGGNGWRMAEFDRWQKEGVPIIGAGSQAAQWELDRLAGMRAFRRRGVAIPPYKQCATIDEALDYVAKRDEGFAVKPCGDVADKSLSFVAKTGKEMAWRLQRWKREGKRFPTGFIVQERIEGVEMAVGAWVGPGGFAAGFEENWEEKRLMADNLGPNCGEAGTVMRLVRQSKLAKKVLQPFEDDLVRMGFVGNVDVNCIIDCDGNPWPLEWTCYDDQTEVLTDRGWKRFEDVNPRDLAATMDPASGVGEFRPISRIISKPYVGEMIEFTAQQHGVDLRVTPDHAMWVNRNGRGAWEFKTAEEVADRGQWKVARAAKFSGEDREVFVLPAYTEHHYSGRWRKYVEVEHPAVSIPMPAWLRFLGLYISEGSLGTGKGGPYQVHIAQRQPKADRVAAMLDGFPVRCKRDSRGFTFSSIQLGSWLAEHVPGLAPQKRVPREFLNLSPTLLAELLDALILGDGSVHSRTGGRVYTTTSADLADDVHEIITRMGNLGRVKRLASTGTAMSVGGGKTYYRNHDIFVVSEATKEKFGWLDRRQARRVRYAGRVWCLNVPPHHLLYVRRNGRASWCGNCRFGYPAINIETALHSGDPIEFLVGLAKGRPPATRDFDKIAVGVVLAIPPYPFGHEKREEVVNVPIWGVSPKLESSLHFTQVMQGDAPVIEGGKVGREPHLATAGSYVLVSTGTGESVVEARTGAYRALHRLTIPASPFWRPDIGSRLRSQIDKLNANGYATGLRYA